MSKKATKSHKEVSSYEFRDVVLGKVRGYPPWPGMVIDPETVPPSVSKERPSNKKAAFYCVRFFPTGDYAWLVAKDISKLQPHEIESYINEPHKKSGDLLQGYRIALEPTKWEKEIEAAGQMAIEEEANAEIDELESEHDDDDSTKAKSKKRKRASEVTSSRTKKASAPVKPKRNGTKSKAMIESEDEGDAGDDDDERQKVRQASPPNKKAKRDEDPLATDPEAIKVRTWKHRLQRSFLSNRGPPREEDIPALDNLFSVVENYDNMNIQYLLFSKIGKVMRHIAVLSPDDVPRDGDFHFRDRAKALVEKWRQILNANKRNGADGAGPNANGTADEGDKAMEPVSEAPKSREIAQESEERGADQSMDMDLSGDGAEDKDAPGSPAPAQGSGDFSESAQLEVTISEAA